MGYIIIRTVLKIVEVPWYDAEYFRNAYLYGFPMLYLGFFIRKYEKIAVKLSDIGIAVVVAVGNEKVVKRCCGGRYMNERSVK